MRRLLHNARMVPLLALTGVASAVAGNACATRPAAPSELPEHGEKRAALSEFSTDLARAGMSVPYPARVCEEPIAGNEVKFDDDVGCVAAPVAAGPNDVVRVYARAIVKKRLPDAPPTRADALSDAWLGDDDARFAALALGVETEFDERRKGPVEEKPKPKKVTRKRARPKPVAPVDGGVVLVDAGPEDDEEDYVEDVVDAGPSAPGVVTPATAAKLTLKERLVGTWIGTGDGPVVPVHSLCSDGKWLTRYEAANDIGQMIVGDMERVKGTWEAIEGDPPKIALIFADGQREEGAIGSLSDDELEVQFTGADTMKYARRAKTASCE